MSLMSFDQPNSFFQTEQPNQNQYLTGDPNTQQGANTDWMSPNTDWTKYGGWSNGAGSSQTNTPPPSGTALGTISNGGGLYTNPTEWLRQNNNGNTGINPWLGSYFPGQGSPGPFQSQGTTQTGVGQYTPEGYDIGKLNDPANANSTKYQVGRILSNFPPGPEGLQQAASQLAALGISVVGRDKIRLPDGTTADVGRAFSDPNANKAWQYNWFGPDNGQGGGMTNQPGLGSPMQSFMGNQQMGGNNFLQNILYQIMQQQRGQAGRPGGGMFNPIGGGISSGGFTNLPGTFMR